MPNVVGVFVNGSVGRETCGIGNVNGGTSKPTHFIGVAGVNFIMSVNVSVEVFENEKFVVALQEIITKRLEVTKSAVGKQIKNEADVVIGIVFIPSRVSAGGVVSEDFAGFKTEDNNIVVADSLANFDVGAVKSA